MYQENLIKLRTILETAAGQKNLKAGSDEQKVGDFFASGMDSMAIEKTGYEPLKGMLAKIDVDLRYELRDVSGSTAMRVSDEVFSDADLAHDLAIDLQAMQQPATVEHASSLLDRTVQSNLELARRYGDLDEQRLLLERRVQELVDVAQQTVHDLNRPISAIRLMLSTLDKGYLGELTAPVQQAVQNGLQAVHQMERLVRDLLDSFRLDHDGMHLEFVDCDLTLLLGDVLRALRYEIEERGVHVRVEPMPTIRADARALTKVFMNLLGNAIRYYHGIKGY